MLSWKFKDVVNIDLIEKIHSIWLVSEWNTLSTIACDYSGYHQASFPIYSRSNIFGNKLIELFILRVGKFSQNRDKSYYNRIPFIIVKCKSFSRRVSVFFTIPSRRV